MRRRAARRRRAGAAGLGAPPGPLDERVRDRIVAETRGNPLALLELPRGADARRAGGRVRAARRVTSLPSRIEESFRAAARAAAGGDAAAAAGRGGRAGRRPALVWRAAARLGIAVDAAAPAAAAGLLEFGARCGSAIRWSARRSTGRRRRRSAGARTARWPRRPIPGRIPTAAPGTARRRRRARRGRRRRARALGRPGAGARRPGGGGGVPRARGRADARSRPAGPSARWPRRRPSIRPARRTRRCGCWRSRRPGRSTSSSSARADLLRAQIAFAANRGSDAPPLLLEAARRLEPLDVALARETYLDAFCRRDVRRAPGRRRRRARGRRGRARRRRPSARPAARGRPAPRRPARAVHATGYAAGAPLLQRGAARLLQRRTCPRRRSCAGCGSPARAATHLWDDETWDALAGRYVQLAREAGALTVLPLALSSRARRARCFAGELAAAASLSTRLEAVTEATGSRPRALRAPSRSPPGGATRPRPPR